MVAMPQILQTLCKVEKIRKLEAKWIRPWREKQHKKKCECTYLCTLLSEVTFAPLIVVLLKLLNLCYT